ncbi:hypothetical protein [Butyrivibrio sp. MC2021]|uniref:hypothetical protein n=1 Tax=Butyrivibrio sp. MC2021 TaxID=1408306 RepID=UPI00047CB06B|nr:hypothetical protein [Butyrivibrio sp. MC2021]
MDEQQKLRKLRHTVYISGLGVLLYGVWSLLKVAISVIADDDVLGLNEIELDAENPAAELMFIYIFAAIFIIILILVHYYLGRCAMKVGRYYSRKRFFLIPTALTAVWYIASIPQTFEDLKGNIENFDTAITSALIDITLIIVLIDIVISTIRISKIERKLEHEERQ